MYVSPIKIEETLCAFVIGVMLFDNFCLMPLIGKFDFDYTAAHGKAAVFAILS